MMIIKKIVILTIVVMVVNSCSRDIEDCFLRLCIDWEEYYSQSTLNGSNDWVGQYAWFGDLNNGNTIIHLENALSFDRLLEKIRIRNIDLAPGKIELNYHGIEDPDDETPIAYFNTFQGRDALTESYVLFDKEDFENYLIINSISANGLEIEGEFQLSFVLSENSPSKFDESLPDTLIFTNGVFKARKLE